LRRTDETAVWNVVQEEITAWNSGDAKAYSHHFAEDCTCTNIRGQFFTGRQARHTSNAIGVMGTYLFSGGRK
jgi:uncharacterized protein (TIGR02246 family)